MAVGMFTLSQTVFAGGAALKIKQHSLGEKEVGYGDKNILVNGTVVRAYFDTEIEKVTFACVGEGVFENVRLYSGSKYLGGPSESYYDPMDGVQREVFDVEINIPEDKYKFLRVIADNNLGNDEGSVDCAITDFDATLNGYDYQVSVAGNMGIGNQNTTFHFEGPDEEDECLDSKSMGGKEIICIGETYTYAGLNIISTNLYSNDDFAVFKTNAWTGYDSDHFVVQEGQGFLLTSKNGETVTIHYSGLGPDNLPHVIVEPN